MQQEKRMDEKILEFIKQVYEEKISFVNEYKESKFMQERPLHKSAELNELFSALAKAQQEMLPAGLDSDNPYFKSKYADLASVVSASRPYLTKNGLSVIQQIRTTDDGATILASILGHSSGQWIETTLRVIPPKNDIQTLGSYLTYIRRYSYAALIGVVAADEDDDGEVAQAHSRETFAKGSALNTKYNPKEQSPAVINKQQMEELEYELAEYPDIAEKILDGLRIQSLADMPDSKYRASITRIREIKNLRNGVK